MLATDDLTGKILAIKPNIQKTFILEKISQCVFSTKYCFIFIYVVHTP